MSDRDEVFSREDALVCLENGMCLDPKMYPFGYYLRDSYIGGSGGFHWNETEESLFDEIKGALFALFPDNGEERDDEIRAELCSIIDSDKSKPKLSNEIREKLDAYLKGGGLRIDWIGTFKQLCEGHDGWAEDVREQYRERSIDDTESISSEEMKAPIKVGDVDGFADYVRDYGQF